MNTNPPEGETWIKPFGNVFLGLNQSAVIRRVIGVLEMVPALDLHGHTWHDFIQRCADESAIEGLDYAWQAMAQHRVAPVHWPSALPFTPGVTAYLRPVEDDPTIVFAVYLSTGVEQSVDALIGRHVLEATHRLVRLSKHVYRGVDGPLTDLQVKDVAQLLTNAEYIQHLLEDLRAEVLTPTLSAPLPHPVAELFAFSERDFLTHRRMETHQLILHTDWSSAVVYCHNAIRETVQHVIETLIAGVTTESAISLTDSPGADDRTIQVMVFYHSSDPTLQVPHRMEPVALADPDRFRPMGKIERLVTAAQARLKPVHGQAWAEPCQDQGVTTRLVLELPRWREPERPE